MIARPSPDPNADMRISVSESNVDVWEGKDVFSQFANHKYGFYEITGESPETLLSLVTDAARLFC